MSAEHVASPEGLNRAIARFPDVTVLVAGDLILDRFVTGVIERISPEAPIPVLHGRGETLALGGAGNVVANIASLGGKAIPVSVLGKDGAGDGLVRMLGDLGADTEGIGRSAGRMTSAKSRYSAQGQQVLRFDEEEVKPLSADQRAALMTRFNAALSRADIVLLSDYGKGVLLDGVAAELIAAARDAGKPVLVDPKGRDFGRYRGATAVTPNRKELGEAVGRAVFSDEEIEAAAREPIAAHGFDFVLATRSEKGMSVVDADSARHIATQAREVFDVSGAGDTVVATLTAALSVGIDLVDSARLANLAAGIVVGKVGTAVVRSAELLSGLHEQEWRHGEEKVLTRDAAAERAERWRLRGKRVGFTNGCFDLLHPGHISLLKQARAACDVLVVGLNSDASVKRLKGDSRPVQNETARATVLASLGCVDLVVIFGEDTPETLIHALRPDVLVKGADYTIATVVGADFVQGYGGKVVLAELVQGQSTTNTIKRMKG